MNDKFVYRPVLGFSPFLLKRGLKNSMNGSKVMAWERILDYR